MAEITTLFWDIGGVILTNAWGRAERLRATDHFKLDREDFERRHQQVAAAFEIRELTLHEYLAETVFHQPRPFSPEEFRRFMRAQSQVCRRALRIVEELSETRRYLMATINNESLELNLYRIRQFELHRYFSAFFSSCFLNVRKPGRELFCRALELTGRQPSECLMIDDRPENLEAPRAMGLRTIEYHSPAQLRQELEGHGIACAASATNYTPAQGA
ncbi:MAG TPA: HAD family phosphatase [Bryobacteraceae bacterium]|nr:HAD family phosphatase [Bryobacteraceae bacterium]